MLASSTLVGTFYPIILNEFQIFFYLFSNVIPELIYSGFQLLVQKQLIFFS